MPDQPVYLSKTKSALFGGLLLTAWLAFVGVSIYFSLFSAANITYLMSYKLNQGVGGGLFLLLGAGSFFVMAPYFACSYLLNIFRINNNMVPANLYRTQLQREQTAVNEIKRQLRSPSERALIRELEEYITHATQASFHPHHGDKLDLDIHEYDKLKTLAWVHNKLDKLKDKPARNRRTYVNKIREKSKANFDPFLNRQRARNARARARDAQAAREEQAHHWQNDIMPRFR